MSFKLRPYQQDAEASIYAAWEAGASNVLTVLPTGAGKTVIFAKILSDHRGYSMAIAHRQELVSQISMALARNAVRHKIVAPASTVKLIVSKHFAELGRSFYDPNARCAVAGVDTLIRRPSAEFRNVTLWVTDEAHHAVRGNKWGKACEMFPNAKGLGVTATPMRADGKGLGRHADGIFDKMIVGPNMRDLIRGGFLTEYRIFAPASDIDLSTVSVTASGDYSKSKLKTAVQKSHITGDVVQHYIKIAPNRLGVTFASDVETATEISEQFNAAGVPAAIVSAKTPDKERAVIIDRFRRRELLQLVNVDLFGEGFDLPAIQVVSMARPTQSYGLYVQQFGRALRLMEGKARAIIIDHVGNVVRHGLPDIGKEWTLDAREKRGRGTPDDVIPLRACPECTGVFERVHKECPYCGHAPQPAARSGPEFVDGDLTELDAETLAAMRGEIADVDMDREEKRAELARKRVPVIGQMAGVKRHVVRQEAQRVLREAIAWWAGIQRAAERPDSESYRRFYFKFGVDVLGAQALGTKDAENLTGRVLADMAEGARA